MSFLGNKKAPAGTASRSRELLRKWRPQYIYIYIYYIYIYRCCQKHEGKHEIPSELILYGLKWKSVFLEKWQGFDVKMLQNCQISVKTFGLEDQYAIIFSLALWAEEPPEVHFF